MCIHIYNKLLIDYGNTLKETSKDSHDLRNIKYMTENKKNVVGFDNYVKSISEDEDNKPRSCDALFFYEKDQKWYLIEFKNGNLIDYCPECKVNEEKYKIKEKILESLLLLTKELDKTIEFFHKNMTFILVYSKDNISRFNISTYLRILKEKELVPKRLELMYLKKIECMNINTFQKKFVEKYCI